MKKGLIYVINTKVMEKWFPKILLATGKFGKKKER